MNSAKMFLITSAIWLGTCVIAGLILFSIPSHMSGRTYQRFSTHMMSRRSAPIVKKTEPAAKSQSRVKINGADALVVTKVTIVRR